MKIENVAIFGGNGTVGSLMGGLIAGLGNANVYLISRDKRKLDEKLLERIYKSIKTDIISNKIILCDYNDAKDNLNKCDWIFESVSEDYKIKKSVYELINEYSRKDAIITTGTSGLSVAKLSEAFSEDRKYNFFGTHFFNPPYHMTLCELIKTKYTNVQLIKEFKEYLEKILLRTTVISEDNPAFIANRIGFRLMNQVLLLADKYKHKGGISYIDSLFTGYTGRNMTPLSTIDFVGIDIHKAIVDNIYQHTEDEFSQDFQLPKWVDLMVEQGRLGNKSGCGLYKKSETILEIDIESNNYVPKKEYDWKEIQDMENCIKNGEYIKAYKELLNCSTAEKEIVVKILIEYIIYSLYISKCTAEKIEDCDDAMATGFGWCPPIAMKELIEQAGNFRELSTRFIGENIMKKYDLYSLIENLPKSKYDYRKYIKAV
ncbi:MAG: 3-hydroxyacyl-CoA dehydrogenase family protein [Clostridia bacterium]